MKAIILAGGAGSRLRPVTYEIPKPLIPIRGKTLTEHVFDILHPHVDEFHLSISHLADQIVNHFSNKKFPFKIDYIHEKERLGTAGPFIILKDKDHNFDSTFVCVNGDNLFDINMTDMLKFHKENNATVTIALKEVSKDYHVDGIIPLGVAKINGHKILDFIEKPKVEDAPSRLINSGYYIMEPEVFDLLKDFDKAMLEKDLFPMLAKQGKLFGYKSDAQWFDTGTFDRWEDVIKNWKTQK